MRKHIWTVLLAVLIVWGAVVSGFDPAHVYAQSIGGNGITGQGGSGFSIAGTGLTSSGGNTVSIISPVTVANGGTQCGAPVAFASLPGSPTNGEICSVTDATACNAGTAVISGGGSTKCQVTYNGTSWMPAGGASSTGGPPSGSASGDLGSTYPGPTVVQVEGAAIPASSNLLGTNSSKQLTSPSNLSLAETTAPSGTASSDILYPDSTAHRWKMNNNNGTAAQVVASGADINTSDQVTVTHLAAGLPRAQGGLNSTSAGTGILRDGTTPAASELSGDATTSGSNAVSVVKVNGGSIPTSATALSSNGSNQIVSATVQGNGSKVQLSTGSTTSGDCVKFDANGNVVDNGSACGSGMPASPTNSYQYDNVGSFAAGNMSNVSTGAALPVDTTGATNTLSPANTEGWLSPIAFGASFSSNTYSGTAAASTSITSLPSNDFVAGEGVFIPHGGAAQTLSTPSAPTVELGTCTQIAFNSGSFSATNFATSGDIGVWYTRNMEPFGQESSASGATEYSVTSGGAYTFSATDQDQPLTVCWGESSPTAGTNTIAVKVAALDGLGGITAASSATTLANVAIALPTETNPLRIYEGTPVTGAAGYAFYESINGGTYYLARVVWVNEPQIDEGTSTTNAGAGYAEWGSWTTQDEQIPATPPASALNDGYFSTVSTVNSSSSLTLATATGFSGSVTLAHDDAPAWNAMFSYCASHGLSKSCNVQLGLGQSRISQLIQVPAHTQVSPNTLSIIGQGYRASGMYFFGQGGAYCTYAYFNQINAAITSTTATSLTVYTSGNQYSFFPTSPPFKIMVDSEEMLVTAVSSGTYTVTRGILGTTAATHLINANVQLVDGGEWQDSLSQLHLTKFSVQTSSSAADCLFAGASNTWLPIEANVEWYGPGATSPIHRLFVWDDGGGKVAGGFQFAYQDIDLLGAVNGATFGQEYSFAYQIWPGEFLYPEIGYGGGNANDTFDTFVFEGPWTAIRADGGKTNDIFTGGYIQGVKLHNPYMADSGQISASECATPNNVGVTCSSGAPSPADTLVTANGNNWILETGIYEVQQSTHEGCVWAQSFVSQNKTLIDNIGCNIGAFGIVGDGFTTIRDSQINGIVSNGVAIALGQPGSEASNNMITGAASSTGNVGYQIGYNFNDPNVGCATGDPFTVQFGTNSQQLSTIATALNACSTANVHSPFNVNFTTWSPGTTNTSYAPTVNYENTFLTITLGGSPTLTFNGPSYFGQTEIVKVCQPSSGGPYTPTFAIGSGITLTGSFPTITSTASKCGDFQLVFDTTTSATIIGANGGPL